MSDTNLSTWNVNNTLGYGSPVLQVSSLSLTPADAVANNRYFSFVVTPGSNATMDFTNLTFNAARGGGATPRGWEVRTDVDGFAAALGSMDAPTQRPTWTAFTVDLTSAAFDNLTAAVEFRVYTYSPNINNSLEYDDFCLNGTVTSVPEPTAGMIFAVGALAIAFRRRR